MQIRGLFRLGCLFILKPRETGYRDLDWTARGFPTSDSAALGYPQRADGEAGEGGSRRLRKVNEISCLNVRRRHVLCTFGRYSENLSRFEYKLERIP